jgi:pyridoxamine 5'-phosphate oxidase
MSLFSALPDDPSLSDPLPTSPLPLLGRWMQEAREGRVQRNPTAMTLATVGDDGDLSARMMLCRAYDEEAGFLVFHTNRESRKGEALSERPEAALVMHWDALQRQVRIEGPVIASPEAESDAYWESRDRAAQIAAAVSAQSRLIRSRDDLLARLHAEEERFGGEAGPPVPRPLHWGGYRVWCRHVELWVGAEGRAHDRVLWSRALEAAGEGFHAGDWSRMRLQP